MLFLNILDVTHYFYIPVCHQRPTAKQCHVALGHGGLEGAAGTRFIAPKRVRDEDVLSSEGGGNSVTNQIGGGR